MLRSGRRLQLLVVLGASVVPILISCKSPALERKQTVRDLRRKQVGEKYILREHESTQHVKTLADLNKKLRVRRVENFRKTLHWAKESERKPGDRLIKQAPVRHKRVRAKPQGKPETKYRTGADMAY